MKIPIIILLFACSIVASADQPLPTPKTYEQYSPNKKYVARSELETKTIVVSQVDADDKRTELWRMPGWHRWVSLTNDGQYLSIPYCGLNLLSLDYKETDIMLHLVKRGKVVKSVALQELIHDFKSLQHTASHYRWGTYLGFNEDNEFIIETVENSWFFINPETGKIREKKSPIK